jgi:hypothetical protein
MSIEYRDECHNSSLNQEKIEFWDEKKTFGLEKF